MSAPQADVSMLLASLPALQHPTCLGDSAVAGSSSAADAIDAGDRPFWSVFDARAEHAAAAYRPASSGGGMGLAPA